ncbi:MAG: hypothetical protein KDM63_05170, partial [Verrucomicrobiae bacterium]|nr:hypothetical protein [Verrucomicrobiae bacterium]
ITGGLLELDRTGVWETDAGQRGAAHLLSRAETDLQPRDPATAESTEPQVRSGLLSGNATWLFLVIVALVLIVESYLFHRHAVY